MIFYACLLVVSWVSSLVAICAVYVAAPRPLHLEGLVKGLAARCRSSVPEVGRSPALTKGIGRHWMIVWCERPREKRNRCERAIAVEVGVQHQTATKFLAGDFFKMHFQAPLHTALPGRNESTKTPPTHKSKVVLGTSHGTKLI